MMTCEQYEEILQNFLDGKLSRLPEPVQAHLDSCANCRQFLAEMQSLQSGLAGLSAQKLSPAAQQWLLARIQARLDRLSSRAGVGISWASLKQSMRWPRLVPAMATLAAIAFLLLQLLSRPHAPETLAGPNELDLIIEEHTRVAEASALHPAPYGVTFIALGSPE